MLLSSLLLIPIIGVFVVDKYKLYNLSKQSFSYKVYEKELDRLLKRIDNDQRLLSTAIHTETLKLSPSQLRYNKRQLKSLTREIYITRKRYDKIYSLY
jgi:hypothetical protein